MISRGRSLFVRFITDDTINWKGFQAEYLLAGPDEQPVTYKYSRETSTRAVPFPNKVKKPSKKEDFNGNRYLDYEESV